MKTNAPCLDPMPDFEMLGSPLDLGRPELARLMDRYRGDRPPGVAAMLGPPTALIVTDRPGEEGPVAAALADEGWSVRTCAGPAAARCPLLRGGRCELRESADAAVVFVDPRDRAALGAIPRLRCAGDSHSPAVVAVEGSLGAARYSGSTATVGSLRGPQAILETLDALLGRGDDGAARA